MHKTHCFDNLRRLASKLKGQEFVVTPVEFVQAEGEIIVSERKSSRLPIFEFVRANSAYLRELIGAVAAGSIGL